MTAATATPARDGSALCLSCGLCCTGVLFQTVRLTPAEVPGARRLQLPVLEGGERAWSTQPCPRHVGGACGIYEERPGACRTFTCHTLAAYLAGDIDLAAAGARIERLRTAAARVLAGLPVELRSLPLWEATHAFSQEGDRSPDPAAWRRRHAGALLDIVELEALCRRDFTARDR
jgi:uncharacterized protein